MAQLQSVVIFTCLLALSIVEAGESPFGAPPPTTTTTTTSTTTIPTTHVPVIESSTPAPILPALSNNETLQHQNLAQGTEGHDHHVGSGIGDLSQNGSTIINSTLAEKHVGQSSAITFTIASSLLLITAAPMFAL